MTRARTHSATIRAAGYSVRGTYHGGPYIDLYFTGDRVPFDVINVWDYAADAPTDAAVRRAMLEWRADAGESLAHDLSEYAMMMRGYR